MNKKLTDEDVGKMEALDQIIPLVEKHWPNHSICLENLETSKKLTITPVTESTEDE